MTGISPDPTPPLLAAGMIIVRPFGDHWRLVVLRQFRNWDLPKGLVDAGESALAGALREAREETGLTDIELAWGDDWRETERYNLRRASDGKRAGKRGGKIVRVFIGRSLTGDPYLPHSAELGRPEHHEVRWVRFDGARVLLPARFHPLLDWAAGRVGESPPSSAAPITPAESPS